MANRRFGGGLGGPPQKHGGFSQPSFQGNKVNPWQGGAAPSNALNSGLLSQLSAPQAQLALALTSLLQPQQQMNNNPPSLLSLPTSPAFNNQDSFGSHNRFNNRGRDFRRPEPYKLNQNRSGNAAWRDNSTRPTGSYNSGGRSLASSNRSGSRSNFGNKDRKSPPKGGKGVRPQAIVKPPNKATAKSSDKAGEKVNDSSKKPQKDEKSENVDSSMDESRDEDGNEAGEKKRDWKQEKNGEEKKEEDDSVLDSVDLTDDNNSATEEDKKDKDKKPREGRYFDVPASLLHCFVCNKSMWDGESFQNHIRGKAHKQMMDSLGQSFQITVNILRENMRLVEEKKMIELERIHRNSRNFHRQSQEPQSHCNMCDLKFLGKIITHRKTDGHQRLKRFLHPKCDYCCQEFPSRMEWVDHRFTPDHLRKVKEILETRARNEVADGAPIDEEPPELDNDPLLEESLQTEDENPVLELTDDLKDLQNRIPAYKPSREIAKKNVQPMSGYYCDICVRFMTSEAAAQEHLRTELHYNSFVESAKRQYKRLADEEKAAADKLAKKRKAEEEEESSKKLKTDDSEKDGAETAASNAEGKGDEMYDPEEACDDNEASLDNAALDEEFAEVDRLIKTVEEDQVKDEAKEEPEEVEEKKAPETASPRARRAAAGGGGVKNGAGPRSKTRRGGK